MTIQEAIKARIDRFNRLYLAAVGHSFEDDPKWCEEQLREGKFCHSSLYPYEMMVIEQAKSIAEWFESQENPKDLWNSMPESMSEFIEELKKKGFNKWDKGHSGNSASMSIMFARTLLFRRNLFPYLHGALTPLVGDEGYHDDRSDVEQALKKESSKE